MKRFNLAAVLGLTVMLLAWAPQLRANGINHLDDDEHGTAIAATTSHGQGSSALHSQTWKDDDDDNGTMGQSSNSGNSNSGGVSNEGSGSSSGSGSMNASAPEPSSLFLLLSGLLAVAVGLKVKKAMA